MSSNLQIHQIGAKPLAHKNDNICFSTVNGMDFLKNPKYCKGLAFSIEERQVLGKSIYSSLSHSIPVYPSISQYNPVYPSLSQFIPVYPSLSQSIPVYLSLFQSIPVYPSLSQIDWDGQGSTGLDWNRFRMTWIDPD